MATRSVQRSRETHRQHHDNGKGEAPDHHLGQASDERYDRDAAAHQMYWENSDLGDLDGHTGMDCLLKQTQCTSLSDIAQV